MKRLICKCGRCHMVKPDSMVVKFVACPCGNKEGYQTMKLLICNAPSVKATMVINNQDDYVKACILIDGCINRNISVAVATNNQTICNWLIDLYKNRCNVEVE